MSSEYVPIHHDMKLHNRDKRIRPSTEESSANKRDPKKNYNYNEIQRRKQERLNQWRASKEREGVKNSGEEEEQES